MAQLDQPKIIFILNESDQPKLTALSTISQKLFQNDQSDQIIKDQ